MYPGDLSPSPCYDSRSPQNLSSTGKGVHGAGSSAPGLDDADVSAVTAPIRHNATSIPPAAAPLAKRQILMCTRRRRHLNSIFADCPCRIRTTVHQFKT